MKLPLTTGRSQRWLVALLAIFIWQAGYAAHHSGTAQTPGKSLGVTISEVSLDALSAVGLDYGIRVVGVMPGSPAARAGFEKDDILVQLNGKPVYSVKQLKWLVRQAPEGSSVPVKLQRGDKLDTASVMFPSSPTPSTGMGKHQVPGGHHGMGHPGMAHGRGMGYRPPGAYLGVQFQPMTQQLRSAFGAPTDTGVLVVAVAENGPAKKAGLIVGDVIVRMDRRTIAGVQDIYRTLAYFDAGDEIEVEVIREKSSQTLMARLDNAPTGMSQLPGHGGPYGHHPMHPYGRP